MNNEFESDIWESILKSAVTDHSLHDIANYSTDIEINKITLPVHYKSVMEKFINRYKKKKKIKSVFIFTKKIACVILIVLGISFAFLLSFDEVRAACRNAFMYVYEKYVLFQYDSHNQLQNLHPVINYIPDSYKLTQYNLDEYELYILYEDDLGDTIELECYFQNTSTQLDNEHHEISNVHINNGEGKFFKAIDIGFSNLLIWNTDNSLFILTSTLNLDTMIKIAENIK